MISGLKGHGAGRMDSFDHKMSKSDPNNAIFVHDTPKQIEKKFRKAFLEVGNPESPVFEIAKHIVMPHNHKLVVEPKPEFGNPSTWKDIDSFVEAVASNEIHPFDAKMAVARGLTEVLSPVVKHFEENSGLLDAVNQITGSQ